MRHILTMVLGLAVIVPAGLAAQERVPGRRAGPRGPRFAGPEVPAVMAWSPGHLLRRRQALDLTDDQVARLEDLARGLRSAGDTVRSAMREHGDALRAAWEADDVDADAVRDHARALRDARHAFAAVQLDAALEARGVLDDRQRGRVEGWGLAAHGRRVRGNRSMPRRHVPRGRRR